MIFIYTNNLTQTENIEMQFATLQNICKQYGYIAKNLFGEFHILSRYEEWKFVPTKDNKGKLRLLHGNRPGHDPNGYHVQFCEYMDYEEMVRYINEHERAKFLGEHIKFSVHPKIIH